MSDEATVMTGVAAPKTGARRGMRPASPGRLIIWRIARNKPALWAARVLMGLYAIALLAPFLAPYGMNQGDRTAPFHPPVKLRGFPPVVHGTMLDLQTRSYREDPGSKLAVKFFARGERYELLPGLHSDIHLFGLGDEGLGVTGSASPARLYLLGADQLGRDIFSRILYGARISLTVGLVGITISFALGLLVGGLAGYYGGWVDTVLMRGSEILMSIPGLYLILALRAAFPASLPSHWTYAMIVVILSFITWTSLGRVVRGMALSIRTRDYVSAAEALGFSPLRIIVRHILPNTLSFVVVAATIAIPGYILAEVALSFLGVGIQEPQASWGNMLQQAASVSNMEAYPWILWPGFFIFITVFSFNVLGDGIRDALDPRHIDA